MLKRIPLTICIALATAALVAGCAPAQPEPTPAPSESATAEPTAEPTTEPTSEPATMEEQLDALRGEVAASSEGCDNWIVSVEGPVGSISGICDDEWNLFVFDTLESRNTVLVLNQESMEPQRFIVGPHWLIAPGITTPSEELDALAAELGYDVWVHTDPIPTQ